MFIATRCPEKVYSIVFKVRNNPRIVVLILVANLEIAVVSPANRSSIIVNNGLMPTGEEGVNESLSNPRRLWEFEPQDKSICDVKNEQHNQFIYY